MSTEIRKEEIASNGEEGAVGKKQGGREIETMQGQEKKCPNGHGTMTLKTNEKTITFRGEELALAVEVYICEKCNLEVGTIDQAAVIQNMISDAYRLKVGLMTGEEIREKREELNLSQKELAKRAGIGIASIKRWENGFIQTRSMNTALLAAFDDNHTGNKYTGNRALSTPRIKLVMKEFEKETGHKFLEEGDNLLFDVKYLWYADMLAYYYLGRGLTGATYAALPFGPQLNNYRDLIEIIRGDDETKAEPLSPEEKKIISRVALTFHSKRSIYNASHREKIWEQKSFGSLIPYSDAAKLTEIQLEPHKTKEPD